MSTEDNADIRKHLSSIPQHPGVYLFKNDEGDVIYIGKSVRLRDRIRSYFADSSMLGPKTKRLVEDIDDIETIETESEIEALILEADLIKRHKPRYNVQWKDDKRYKYIEVGNYKQWRKDKKTVLEENVWLYVTTTRNRDNTDSIYFGPFPAARTIKRVMKTLRKLFPWCKYKSYATYQRNKKACFYQHLDLCPGICADEITLEEYWDGMDQLVMFLEGKKEKIIKNVEKKMHKLANEKRFEEAAEYRDRLKEFEYITQEFRDSQAYIQNPNLREDLRFAEISGLIKVLSLEYRGEVNDFHIEGYDISNLGKEFTVGSRVAFVGGEADKSLYRRYKIRTEELPDDYAAMEEVLSRRLKKKDDLPDLLLIDGGKGQLQIVLQVLEVNDVFVPVIGLAKQEEVIIQPTKSGFKSITLGQDSPALKLVQRVRDESHRFAQSYHKLLRRKRLKE